MELLAVQRRTELDHRLDVAGPGIALRMANADRHNDGLASPGCEFLPVEGETRFAS
jgi:hypothetical protein